MNFSFLHVVTPYLFPFMLFCLDIWAFFLLGQQAGFFLLSFFIAILFARPFSWGHTTWLFLLLMSTSFTIGPSLWWPLLSALPACIIILTIRTHIFPHFLYPALATGLCIAVDLLLMRPFLLKGMPDVSYTMGVIFSNIMIAMFFSLKLKTGKMRQSLTHRTV